MADNEKRNKLHSAILEDLNKRTAWEQRQVMWYEMRHNGLRRKNKPWPNAADLHWPLIDTNIEKLKPILFQQIVGMDVVSSFIPMRQQLASFTTTAEQWFDFKIKEKTNLATEALSWIDNGLVAGRAVMKCFWDVERKQVRFDAINPMFIIVPSYTTDLQSADRIVHVMPMSEAAYISSGRYDTNKELIKKIKGSGDSESGTDSEQRQTKQTREGITHDTEGEKIIVWEVYERQGMKWTVSTYSPNDPDTDLRDPMELPYDHGKVPFADYCYEVKDKGWYSPRGVCEILAPYEMSLCNTWNHKHDAMALFNKPMFRAERDIPNSTNIRMMPGQILPFGVAPVQSPQPPISFDQEMTSVRQVAEQRIGNPDYGMGQVVNTTNRRTATEIEAINAQTAQTGDLRARLFRIALGELYKQAWGLYLQYDKKDLQFRYLQDSMEIDPEALHDEYFLEPKGGIDQVSKQFLMQKAVQRKQIFAQSPWIDQAELDKSILELDDPSLIKRVFKDPNEKMQDQSEDEMRSIPAMLIGAPIRVKQGEDYQTRLGVLMQYVQNAASTGKQLPEEGVQRIMERIDGLLKGFEQLDANAARKMRKEIGNFFKESQKAQAQQAPPQQAPPQKQLQITPEMIQSAIESGMTLEQIVQEAIKAGIPVEQLIQAALKLGISEQQIAQFMQQQG